MGHRTHSASTAGSSIAVLGSRVTEVCIMSIAIPASSDKFEICSSRSWSWRTRLNTNTSWHDRRQREAVFKCIARSSSSFCANSAGRWSAEWWRCETFLRCTQHQLSMYAIHNGIVVRLRRDDLIASQTFHFNWLMHFLTSVNLVSSVQVRFDEDLCKSSSCLLTCSCLRRSNMASITWSAGQGPQTAGCFEAAPDPWRSSSSPRPLDTLDTARSRLARVI